MSGIEDLLNSNWFDTIADHDGQTASETWVDSSESAKGMQYHPDIKLVRDKNGKLRVKSNNLT